MKFMCKISLSEDMAITINMFIETAFVSVLCIYYSKI